MGVVCPTARGTLQTEDATLEIDRRFAAAVASIGYDRTELSKLSKNFDIASKVTTIVSLQTPEEKRACLCSAIAALKQRHSLMHLLFLRKILEGRLASLKSTASIFSGSSSESSSGSTRGRDGDRILGKRAPSAKHKPSSQSSSSSRIYDLTAGREKHLFQLFMASDPLLLLSFSFEATNAEFLENLVEFLLFVLKVYQTEFPVLPLVLRQCHRLRVSLVLSYASHCKDITPLYAHVPVEILRLYEKSIGSTGDNRRPGETKARQNVPSTYIGLLVWHCLNGERMIEDELDFLWKRKCCVASFMVDIDQLSRAKSRFANKASYEKLHSYISQQLAEKRSEENTMKKDNTEIKTMSLESQNKSARSESPFSSSSSTRCALSIGRTAQGAKTGSTETTLVSHGSSNNTLTSTRDSMGGTKAVSAGVAELSITRGVTGSVSSSTSTDAGLSHVANMHTSVQITPEVKEVVRLEDLKRMIDELRKHRAQAKAKEAEIQAVKNRIAELEARNKDLERTIVALRTEKEEKAKMETTQKESQNKLTRSDANLDEKRDSVPGTDARSGAGVSLSPFTRAETKGGAQLSTQPQVLSSKKEEEKDNAIKAPTSGMSRFAARFGARKGSAAKTEKAEKFSLPSEFTAKSYVGLPWKKCSSKNAGIFQKVNLRSLSESLSVADFESLEDKKKSQGSAKISFVSKGQSVASSAPAASILEHKKAMALNIALSRVRISNDELIASVCSGKLDNESLVAQLLAYYPSSAELEMLSGAKQLNGRAEELFASIKDHDEFRKALFELRFRAILNRRDYSSVICRLGAAFSSLMSSESVLRLFERLLAIGNVLNNKKFSGNAEGFTIDSMKSFCKPDILRLVIGQGKDAKHKLDVQSLARDIESCSENWREAVGMEVLSREVAELRRRFSECPVSGQAAVEYEKVVNEFELLEKRHKEFVAYFGADFSVVFEELCHFVKALEEFTAG